jgi:hypothetical protein
MPRCARDLECLPASATHPLGESDTIGASRAAPTHGVHRTCRDRQELSEATRAVGDPGIGRCCLVGLTHPVGSDRRSEGRGVAGGPRGR